jgi:adenylate cyclase
MPFIVVERHLSPVPLEDQCVIGRKRTVDVVLDDQRVSREHAMIRREGQDFFLYDLDSANGTMHNGAPVSRPTRLKDGDRIQIGNTAIGFESENAEASVVTTLSDATMIGFAEHPMLFLVADVKGYTRLSQKLTDSQLTELMREWYAQCQEAVQRSGGIIDKFIGDAVFAYWMSTRSSKRSEAVECAQSLLKLTKELSVAHADLLQPHGIQLECGVGLHHGLASLGAMVRGQKTALGDAVNVAFRLESLTRQLDPMLLLSGEFVSGWDLGDLRCELCGHHPVKGHDVMLEVYRLQEG